MRGILALVILVHHLFQYSHVDLGFFLDHTLQAAGYLAVGMFYFLSGYGLARSSRKGDYLQRFFKRRFIPLYAFYVFLIIVYAGFERMIRIDWTLHGLLQSFFFGGSLVVLGWYLQTLFLLYILYWAIFTTILDDERRLLILTASLVLYCLACYRCGLASTWYESVFCFPVGMLWAFRQQAIDSALLTSKLTNTRKAAFWLASLAITVGTTFGAFLSLLSKLISAVCFSVFIIITKYAVGDTKVIFNQTTHRLGTYALEVYVYQGLFLCMKQQECFALNSNLSFALVTILGTILIAYVMQRVWWHLWHWINRSLQLSS